MVTRKERPTLLDEGAKIGEPVPRGIVDLNTASVGIPAQPVVDAQQEIGALRRQLEAIRDQLSGAVAGGARQAARQTKATIKLYPIPTLVVVAGLTGVFALAVAGLKAASPRSRYDQTLDDLRSLYDRIRERF